MNEENHKCCICGKQFKGYGNNPAPLRDRGRCCDDCNINAVIPTRILAMKNRKSEA